MASIRMKGLVKRFDELTVIPPIDLEIRDQEFVVFVGPSGCGKSTLLRLIAGLETVDAGDLYIGEARVNDVAPARRDIAMVFQDYALYPHMTVYDNMAFALEMRGIGKKEIGERVKRAAGLLHIEPFLSRKPKALSGGQRQRVAMGRAMVRNPQVFLFDEPLSNLDAKLRGEVRTEIKALSQQLKTTMVFVTHDQVEAMTMADRIVVLKAGVVQQFGTPAQVYRNPANQFVAGFIGSPTMNFFPVAVAPNGVRLDDGIVLGLPPERLSSQGRATPAPDQGPPGLVLGVRPEHLVVQAPGSDGICARVTVVEPLGSDTLVYFDRDGVRHVARVPPELPVAPGDSLSFGFDADKVHLFESGSGEVLRPAAGGTT